MPWFFVKGEGGGTIARHFSDTPVAESLHRSLSCPFGAPEMMKSSKSTAEGAESAAMLFIRIVLSAISACSAVT
jgi:hypothetical protein